MRCASQNQSAEDAFAKAEQENGSTSQTFQALDGIHRKLDWTNKRENRAAKMRSYNPPREDRIVYPQQTRSSHSRRQFRKSLLWVRSKSHRSQRLKQQENLVQHHDAGVHRCPAKELCRSFP